MPELILKEKTIRKRNGGLKIEKEDVTEVYYGDVLVGTFSQVEEMGQKLYLVTNYISDEKKVVGVMNLEGKIIVEKMDEISPFRGRFARASKGDERYFIDVEGNIQKTEYNFIRPLDIGTQLWCVGKTDETGSKLEGYIDLELNPVLPCEYKSVRHPIAKHKLGKTILLDENFRNLTGFIYDDIEPLTQGKFIIKIGTKCGVIDSQGRILVNCLYDEIGIKGSEFVLKQNGKIGALDLEAGKVVKCTYERIEEFDNDFFRTINEAKYGLINKEYEEIVPCQYDWIGFFDTSGLALVQKDMKMGFINKEGKEVVPCQYDTITSFVNGVAKGCIGGQEEDVSLPA